jgi:hypothetical protein
MDILKKGAKISSDGYKVYSCSPQIMDEGVVDLPFFANAVQSKQSYNDPNFMEDAYLYYTPDNGQRFLANFYPVPFNKEAKGDYSHRPGNFVNHVLIGDFKSFYPFETFGNESIWNAKVRGEAFYYEHEQPSLNPRSDVNGNTPKIGFNEVGKFISDGRKDTLAKAVAFLVEQYAKSAEDRQYLVIRDENSYKIELWIAAIQCAFSPKIASTISFATRMDKFVNANRYTVNQTGAYQAQINLQDPNQKQRWRAMIIGIDERDKANVGAARSASNSPFVLLDGIAKTIGFSSTDVSKGYFSLVTSFSDEHKRFCREFLQSLNVSEPSDKIYNSCDIFNALNDLSGANVKNIASALNGLKSLNMSGTQYFNDVYTKVCNNVPVYLQHDTNGALDIIDWLVSVNPQVRDTLMQTVCNSFIDCLFNAKNAESYWQTIITKSFSESVAPVVVNPKTIEANNQNIQSKFKPADAVAFFKIYNECLRITRRVGSDNYVLTLCLFVCFRHKDKMAFQQLVASKMNELHDILPKIAVEYKSEPPAFSEYIMSSYLEMPNNAIGRSDDSFRKFCQQLKLLGLDSLLQATVKQRFDSLKSLLEYEQFLKLIGSNEFEGALSADFIVRTIYATIDSKIKPTDMGSLQLAESLLKQSNEDTKICKNSANLCILSRLQRWERQNPVEREQWIKWAISNKLPTTDSADYVRAFVECMTKANANTIDEHLLLVNLLVKLPMSSYIEPYVASVVKTSLKRPCGKLYPIVYFIMENQQQYSFLKDIVENNLLDSKPNEKDLAALGETMKDAKTKAYFQTIEVAVLEELNTRKSQSFFGKLFGGKTKDKDDKKNKKDIEENNGEEVSKKKK